MTPEERRKPKVLDASRRRRIAKGAGLEVQDLNRLIKQFEQTKVMMKTHEQREKWAEAECRSACLSRIKLISVCVCILKYKH